MSHLAEQLALLAARVDELAARLGELDGLGVHPVDWQSLDAPTAEAEWAALAGWTDWLVDRYRLAETVPACWYAHPPLVEELSALRAAWLGTYCDPLAGAVDGVLWHDALERVLARIRDWDAAGCAAAGTHREEVSAHPDPAAVVRRTAAIAADVAARPRPAPAPDPGPGLRPTRGPSAVW